MHSDPMPLHRAFRDELSHLRLQGKKFALENPQLARFLGERASDPDVERLLEGFSFLTAKLRMKIEDDFEELTHGLLQLLWPNYLRPIPSMTILKFEPSDRAIADSQTIPKGAMVGSVEVDGVACRFRTCSDVLIHPLEIEKVHEVHSLESSMVAMELRTLSDLDLRSVECDELELHFGGDDKTAQTLYLWLARYLEEIRIVMGDSVSTLPTKSIQFPGFEADAALLPYPRNVFDGYRVLQEFFVFPRRFYFARIKSLAQAWPAQGSSARIELHFNRPMPLGVHIRNGDISLHCVPAVNLFAHDAEPIRVDGRVTEYAINPAGTQAHGYEVFSVDGVSGVWASSRERAKEVRRTYHDFYSFQHEIDRTSNGPAPYYRSRLHVDQSVGGTQQRIAFIRSDESLHPDASETVSVQLTCTNRDLPSVLVVGDVCHPLDDVPAFVNVANAIRPTPSYRPVLDGSLHWNLISNLSLNFLSLLGTEPMKAVIRAYDFAALHDVQAKRVSQMRLNGIVAATTVPSTAFVMGLPVRGLKTVLELDPSMFLCEGEMYLFGSVLSHFFSLYASINAFHVLEVINTENKETYQWPIRHGSQPII
ncbi:type VI secretion system baseplate subunit TssF [Stenotrophomonas maltophilia]|uniref:type VI secretion system baseplate subunit TssF n=1 Tax=Stenotrophomonas TaxID=40323 RepID=UPI0018D4BDB8|nr:type VI secretion system baseplate subunit TssF [Stenotrophomonas sp. SMYL89]MBH1866842.1 type VI secretion system baseplate subunit TssF [Stenotrophomonas maltophilia]HDS1664050.1 type VI secretion system baseplate subunit TssF [Stenotrophomonas maltophilia]